MASARHSEHEVKIQKVKNMAVVCCEDQAAMIVGDAVALLLDGGVWWPGACSLTEKMIEEEDIQEDE
uniref:Uncharacterized protein n=1 Tax=Magallana gigas TaxID=29159 RepID=K1PFX6_MAGGI